MDIRWGAKYVFRYNTVHNPWITTHSGCTNGVAEPIWVEIYKNTFTDDANRYFQPIWIRSSSGLVWGNTSSAPLNVFAIGIDFERAWTSCGGVYGARCDGTRAWDENAGPYGYKCLGQPGWGQPQAGNMNSATFQGVFAWGNRNGGTLVNLGRINDSPYQSDYLVFGRELFNEANMTTGLIANRPSTCNPGPAGRSIYISTNENSQGATMYVCTATNVWTKHWEPYSYPHPLTLTGGGSGTPTPNSPTGLIVQ